MESGILERFGFCRTFSASPQTIQAHRKSVGFAQFAYLDNPLPSLLKERLFVYLSLFCEVRYCIARHLGFLVGLGRPAGDPIACRNRSTKSCHCSGEIFLSIPTSISTLLYVKGWASCLSPGAGQHAGKGNLRVRSACLPENLRMRLGRSCPQVCLGCEDARVHQASSGLYPHSPLLDRNTSGPGSGRRHQSAPGYP